MESVCHNTNGSERQTIHELRTARLKREGAFPDKLLQAADCWLHALKYG
jgi:hypothetical protein